MTEDDAHDDTAPGWQAIDAALAPLYAGQEPKHVGTIIKWMLGGPDPLDGISAWKRTDPVPHWHFVSYGLSELYGKDSDNAEVSGWGFELTFRLGCDEAEEDPPAWAFSLMQNLARYVFQSGNVLGDGEWMNANGPIALETETQLMALAFIKDPELPQIDTLHGSVDFIQIVGLTLDEMEAGKQWQTRGLLDALLPYMPLWTTDLSRSSLLKRSDVYDAVEAGKARDGSSMGVLFMPAISWSIRKRLLQGSVTVIRLGAGHVEELLQSLSMRLPFGRDLYLAGSDQAIAFAPGESMIVKEEGGNLHVSLNLTALEAVRATLRPVVGEYRVRGLPGIVWEVERTNIRNASGHIVRSIG
ncbi:suppressor of fused domain protein [Sphingomonas sp. R647]|uniref:suppressor of fused domain protein n=1 Tax=Sphingomonas sp. R647 TaxID=2875233 RepID=UPI001CD43FA4|nr:suppressor of fused domain protein [Sphingomonas sp. R647]MCA1196383.1 suppressor of fused domain protein [Sphingomonas sp. R647]